MISSVYMKNFRNFHEIEVPFSGRDLILGLNGTGKTTMLLAISIALTGKHPYGGKQLSEVMELIPENETEGIVGVTVDKGEDRKYYVERKFIRGKDSNTQELRINKQSYTIGKGNEMILSLIGDFLPRFNIYDLILMKDRDKHEFLFKHFGSKLINLGCDDIRRGVRETLLRAQQDQYLGVLRLVYNVTEEESLPPEKKAEFWDKLEMSFIQFNEAEGRQYKEIISEVKRVANEPIIQEFIQNILASVNNLKNLRQIDLDTTRKALEKNREYLRTMRKLSDIDSEITSIKAKDASLEDAMTGHKAYKTKKDEYDQKKANLEKRDNYDKEAHQEAKNKVKTYETHYNNISKKLEELQALKEKMKELKLKEDAYVKKTELSKEISELKKEIGVIEKDIAAKRVLAAKQTKLQEGVQQNRDTIISLNAQIASISNLTTNLTYSIERFDSGKCPVCSTSVDSKDMGYDLEADKNLLKEKESEIAILKKTKGEVETQMSDLEDKVREYDKSYLPNSLEKHIQLREATLQSKKDTLASKEKTYDGINATSDDHKAFEKLTAEIATKEKSVPPCKVSKEEYDSAKQTVKDSEQVITSNAQKEEDLAKLVEPAVIPFPENYDELKESYKLKLAAVVKEKEETTENQGIDKVIAQQENDADNYEAEAKYVRAMEKELIEYKNVIISKMLGQIPAKAQKIVSNVMPKLKVIFDNERCGAEQNGLYVPLRGLSGAEGVIVAGAVIAAMMQEADVEERVLTLEGNELDNINLIKLMDTLADTGMDNVVLTTFPRGGALKAGVKKPWTVVDVN